MNFLSLFADDTTTPVKSARDATVVSRDGGHEFVDPTEWGSNIPGVFCRKCLLMRRADGTCNPCKGKAKLRL
jgi:hypothetical protein